MVWLSCPTNCNLKRRALHPNACSAGLSSIHSWVQLGSFLHAVIGWKDIFPAQKRYRALPWSPGFHTSPVRHCPRALPAKLLWQHRIMGAAGFGGSFAPIVQHEKWEIHSVFPHFSYFRLCQKLSPNLLAPLCGVALGAFPFCRGCG